ncbi:unnamed protein product [Rotaria socialis]|uniref:Uncharacterized protein n=1 Tax=Rotaria socialis TaxID=392032 RepID=A0A818EIK0_9BILA|nr:unnamed protein product [Rotaria socialis]CAF4510045.1 unnamed protein product [Rotaria socialis]
MGGKQSYFTDEELRDYQTLTFLSRQGIIEVVKRFIQLTQRNRHNAKIHELRLSKNHAIDIPELRENPFRKRIVEVFSSQPDGSLSVEDFLDMMSVFSQNAPKSVKVSYAFKIYQGIGARHSTADDGAPISNAIDVKDVKEIVRRLSGKQFNDRDLTKIAEAVINEVDLRGDKIITAEIFEYFLSNVPDFPSTFVIPLSK